MDALLAVAGVAAPAGVPVPLCAAEVVAALVAPSPAGAFDVDGAAAALGAAKASAGTRFRMASSSSCTAAAEAWREGKGEGEHGRGGVRHCMGAAAGSDGRTYLDGVVGQRLRLRGRVYERHAERLGVTWEMVRL